MSDTIATADLLKKLEEASLPDERSAFFSRMDQSGSLREDNLSDHHADIARFRLTATVPHDIAVQFETAKNLYLYAWYVYRFYPVSEMQALASLEMGLRSKFPGPLPPGYGFKNRPNDRPTLAPLLRFAIDCGTIKNGGFSRWHKHVQQRAMYRVMFEEIELFETTSPEASKQAGHIVLIADDMQWDFISVLEKVLPGIRNSYAHGSSRLNNQVLGTFELVAEILTQLYPER